METKLKQLLCCKIHPQITNIKEITDTLRMGGRYFLLTLKQKSMRINNAWFRILTLEKRRFIDAVIQTVDKIRSNLLLKILVGFTQKLLQAIGGMRGLIGELAYTMQTFGHPLAQRISKIAKEWGNKTAASWANDIGFIRYLTVIDINNLPIFKQSNKP
ncbi:MAG: hypothetical protein NWE98_00120 [Candidatus Bathyarchaeota archaeon]|nr:hypothetical protein [Candidatus Bathyarchaeota archaeon]